MRTIKFRAWDTDSKAMFHTISIDDMVEYYISMQFTGLKDKNGKEIYEGDIVIYNRGVGNWTGQRMSTTHEIVFTDEVFAFVMKYGSSYIKLRKHWNYIYEVVGNIYENPELLSTPTAVL